MFRGNLGHMFLFIGAYIFKVLVARDYTNKTMGVLIKAHPRPKAPSASLSPHQLIKFLGAHAPVVRPQNDALPAMILTTGRLTRCSLDIQILVTKSTIHVTG